jgi:hypothetical protein
MSKSFSRTLVLGIGLAICTGQAFAQALTGFSGGTLFATFEADGDTIGWQFSVNRAVTITHLGFWDGDAATQPMVNSHAVGLWDNGGNLLTSNTVNATSPFTGPWRYEPTANVTIGPGTYNLGAFVAAANGLPDGYMTGTTGITMAPGFTMLGTLRDPSGPQTGLVFPSVVTAVGGRFGPNILFADPVPEPASLLALGGLCAAFLRRRSRKSA